MEQLSAFPFRKLRNDKHVILDLLMHVEYLDTLKFMYNLHKQARKFIEQNLITVKNGFINDGLIDFVFDEEVHTYNEFKFYRQFEQVYLQALKRQPQNRIITLNIYFNKNIEVQTF